jgi:hypothetical protein
VIVMALSVIDIRNLVASGDMTAEAGQRLITAIEGKKAVKAEHDRKISAAFAEIGPELEAVQQALTTCVPVTQGAQKPNSTQPPWLGWSGSTVVNGLSVKVTVTVPAELRAKYLVEAELAATQGADA